MGSRIKNHGQNYFTYLKYFDNIDNIKNKNKNIIFGLASSRAYFFPQIKKYNIIYIRNWIIYYLQGTFIYCFEFNHQSELYRNAHSGINKYTQQPVQGLENSWRRKNRSQRPTRHGHLQIKEI